MDLLHQKFDKLKVIGKTSKRKHYSIVWICQCDCGNQIEVPTHALRYGEKRNCGCERNVSPPLEFNGQSKSVYQWSQITGIPVSAIRGRLRLGWSVEKILTTPSKKQNHQIVNIKMATLLVNALNGDAKSKQIIFNYLKRNGFDDLALMIK